MQNLRRKIFMKSEKIIIKGMSCIHCVKAVKEELSKLNIKVKNVEIGLADVEYEESKVDRKEILRAIEEAGYSPSA
jgi:copper chaperone